MCGILNHYKRLPLTRLYIGISRLHKGYCLLPEGVIPAPAGDIKPTYGMVTCTTIYGDPMAVFCRAECLCFMKNDTKIPILYVSLNNYGGKKFRNFYQFCRK